MSTFPASMMHPIGTPIQHFLYNLTENLHESDLVHLIRAIDPLGKYVRVTESDSEYYLHQALSIVVALNPLIAVDRLKYGPLRWACEDYINSK